MKQFEVTVSRHTGGRFIISVGDKSNARAAAKDALYMGLANIQDIESVDEWEIDDVSEIKED